MSNYFRNAVRLAIFISTMALFIWSVQGAFHALSNLNSGNASAPAAWRFIAENRFLDSAGYLICGLAALLLTARKPRMRRYGFIVFPCALLLICASNIRIFGQERSCSLSNGIWDSTNLVCHEELALP